MRPIDADALIPKLKDWQGDKEDVDMDDPHDVGYYAAMGRAIRMTELLPTIDAVPVVRCKDCEFRGESFRCPLVIRVRDTIGFRGVDNALDNDFCSRGKRRDAKEG